MLFRNPTALLSGLLLLAQAVAAEECGSQHYASLSDYGAEMVGDPTFAFLTEAGQLEAERDPWERNGNYLTAYVSGGEPWSGRKFYALGFRGVVRLHPAGGVTDAFDLDSLILRPWGGDWSETTWPAELSFEFAHWPDYSSPTKSQKITLGTDDFPWGRPIDFRATFGHLAVNVTDLYISTDSRLTILMQELNTRQACPWVDTPRTPAFESSERQEDSQRSSRKIE